MQREAIPLTAVSDTIAETRRTVQELAQAYGSKVYLAAFRILGSEAAAQDVQQDVFVRLLRSLPNEVESWAAFLTAMATRRAIDQFRSDRRRSRLLALLGPRAEPRSPEDLSQTAELAPAMRAALGALSRRESQAFCLRYLSDFSVSEVAQALDITENNVGVVLHRARGKLAKRLAPLKQEDQR